MSKFYVGQRVRKVRRKSAPMGDRPVDPTPIPVGSVGTIVGHSDMPDVIWVLFDDVRSNFAGNERAPAGTFSQWEVCLEPIDDDSRSLTTWDEVSKHIGWKPGQRVGA